MDRVPLFCALDVGDVTQALKIAELVSPFVGGFKIGPRLAIPFGRDLIGPCAKLAPVFLDCKFFDIPSTMEASVRAAFDQGVSFTTVHAMAGPEALRRLAALEAELATQRPFRILAVTLLTSFSFENLPPNLRSEAIESQVLRLAESVTQAGLGGLVCSAQEAPRLRSRFPHLYIVTPGIRFRDEEPGDQSRVVEPLEALKGGANAIVVGRPICSHDQPAEAARRYFVELQKAQKKF